MILLRSFCENMMCGNMKSGKFCVINLISDLLKEDTAQVKMFMQQWDGLIVVVTLLFSLFIKQINVL